MNPDIEIALCVIAWAGTLAKFRSIHWKNIRKNSQVVLNLWLTMLTFSITLTFLVEGFANFIDARTLNNLSRLIAYCSVILALYFSTVATLRAVEKPSDWLIIRWIRISVSVTIIALIVIYARFIRDIPQWKNHHVPQSLPEAMFMLTMFACAFTLCIFMSKSNIAYLPVEKSTVMRLRVFSIILTSVIAGIYSLVKIILIGGYFWPFLVSPALINLSLALLILTALFWTASLLSNKVYIRMIVISRSFRSWNTFQDLKYMMDRLLRLCPEVALPVSKPPFWKFMLNPEYYLYRAIVLILDSKAMLADFLSESEITGNMPFWDDGLQEEAIEVNQVLQSIPPVDDFWEMVIEYQRASKELLHNRYSNKLPEGAY